MSCTDLKKIEDLLAGLEGNPELSETVSKIRTEIDIAYKKVLTRENRFSVAELEDEHGVAELFDSAIRDHEFKVFYQPKVNLKTYEINGAEALCRWVHNGKMIYPDSFIPILERNADIERLDFYMLDCVCADIRRWIDEKKEVVQISVNISRANVGQKNLIGRIVDTIDKYRIPHSFIQIELTESFNELGFDELRELVLGLGNAGISTAVDDFGTGYSSLKLINELPWNVLKIDKSLLHVNEKEDSNGHMMLMHIISMVRDLGMECVVEGVETPEDVKLLKDNNCFFAQGFYFDKPMSRDVFELKLGSSV